MKIDITVPTGSHCIAAGIKCAYCDMRRRRLVRTIAPDGMCIPFCYAFQQNLQLCVEGNGFTVNKCESCKEAEKNSAD